LRSLRNETILIGREVDFVFEYVKEAHAHDEWPISSGRFNHGNGPVRVDQPTTNTHRLTLARRFQNEHDPNRDAFDVALARTISNEATSSSWSSRPGRFGSSASGAGTAIAAKRKQNATYDLVAVRNWVLGLEDFASQAGE
jgi:hypothetical protein